MAQEPTVRVVTIPLTDVILYDILADVVEMIDYDLWKDLYPERVIGNDFKPEDADEDHMILRRNACKALWGALKSRATSVVP